MYKLKFVFPTNVLRILYSTLVLPYLNYGILAWGNSAKEQMKRILLIQKRAVRTITNADMRSHTDNLFKEHAILKIEEIYKYSLGSLMYQLNRAELPQALAALFVRNSEVHNYPTRQSSFFHLPRVRTRFKLNTVIYTAPKFWNSLDESTKRASSLFVFKRKLKTKLLNDYQILS